MPKWPPATILDLPTVLRHSTGKAFVFVWNRGDGGGSVMVGYGPAVFVAGSGWG